VWEHHVLPTMREAAQRPEAVPSDQLVAATAFPLLAGLLGPPAASSSKQQQQRQQLLPRMVVPTASTAETALKQLQLLAVVATTAGNIRLGGSSEEQDAAAGTQAGQAEPAAVQQQQQEVADTAEASITAASETATTSSPPVVYLPFSLGNSVDLPAAFPAKKWTMVSSAYAAVRGVSREAWAWLFGQLGVHTSLPILRRTLHIKGRQDWLASSWAQGVPTYPDGCGEAAAGSAATAALPDGQLHHLRQSLAPLLASASPTSVVIVEDHHCPDLEELLAAVLASGGSHAGSQQHSKQVQQLQRLAAMLDSVWNQYYCHGATASARAAGGAGEALPLTSSFLLALWRLPWLPDSVGGLSQPGRLFVREAHVSSCAWLRSHVLVDLLSWLMAVVLYHGAVLTPRRELPAPAWSVLQAAGI
jgi:hypothetical protein